jgi:hypothetical protein
MKSTNATIYDLLTSDSELLSMLASNAPFYSPNGTKSTANSIVPADMVKRELETPFITVQEGNENKSGHVLSQTFYVRCYNDVSKSYIEINEILDKVREILNNSEMTLTDRRHVKSDFESRMPGLVEEAMELKFKEERFRFEVL